MVELNTFAANAVISLTNGKVNLPVIIKNAAILIEILRLYLRWFLRIKIIMNSEEEIQEFVKKLRRKLNLRSMKQGNFPIGLIDAVCGIVGYKLRNEDWKNAKSIEYEKRQYDLDSFN
jgi:hypothetical protein